MKEKQLGQFVKKVFAELKEFGVKEAEFNVYVDGELVSFKVKNYKDA